MRIDKPRRIGGRRVGPRRAFQERPLTNRQIDLARQAKLIAPAEATTPTEKRLQERLASMQAELTTLERQLQESH